MTIDFQPYVGPRPYERYDLSPFFGRNREADELVSLIISSWEVLFYAQSGTGKTSLLNVGVIPLLEEEGFEILPLARVQGVIPEGIRSEEIQNLYVFNTLMSWAKDEANPERFVQMSFIEYLKERKYSTDNEEQPRPRVLIFDQFEEIFKLYHDRWNDRNDFFKQVRDALRAENRFLRVIFTIREDFIAQLDPYSHLLPEKLRTRFRMERLRMEAALSAVTGPLRGTNRSFAKGVAEKLVEDLQKTKVETMTGETIEVIGEFVEPVQLQVVCQSLWQELPPDVTEITEQHVLATGGVDRLLSRFYESAIKSAAIDAGIKEGELRQWCKKYLITSTGTRGIIHRGIQSTEGIPNLALDILVDKHLINLEWRAGALWYELTHDRFIEPILASNASATIIEIIEMLKAGYEAVRTGHLRNPGAIRDIAASFEALADNPDIDVDVLRAAQNLDQRAWAYEQEYKEKGRPGMTTDRVAQSQQTQIESKPVESHQKTIPIQPYFAPEYPPHSDSEIELLKEAYEAVRTGRIRDPQTIRAIAARFEEHVYDPNLDFYPLRAAEILYSRARYYEEQNYLKGHAHDTVPIQKDNTDVVVKEEKDPTNVTVQLEVQPDRKDIRQANDDINSGE